VGRTDEMQAGSHPGEAAAPSPGSAETAPDTKPWVIRRKITPLTLADDVVPRQRLEALLMGLIDQHRLVFVYASAGAGKTTAILQAAQRVQRQLVWLDVDTTDSATGRLLVYLEAALALQVPQVTRVATSALSAQIPHAEVAGLLAESIGDSNVLIVLDNVERLATSAEALDVIASFARYLPPTARLVLASRTQLPFSSSFGEARWVAAVGEEDLALTVDEATEALAASGRSDIDPVDALVETGGWMTGVLFEAWRASDHVMGLGGEADPLHGYLATQILDQLGDADAEFLISTALLEEVTVANAEALGLGRVSERMYSLREGRLPVSWHHDGASMRCHPRFREFLLRRLERLDDEEQRRLRRAHARLLASEGLLEEAVEEYLAAGSPAEALEVVNPVLERVIERADFVVAQRWLDALAPVRPDDDVLLAPSELMLAVVQEKFYRGVALADRLEELGLRMELARSSERAAGLMAWCYLHAGRVVDIDAIVDMAGNGPDADAARYALSVVRDEPGFVANPRFRRLSGGPMDALVLRIHFDLGRLPLLTVAPTSPWAAKAAESWLVSALLAAGHTERAFEVYHRLADLSDASDPSGWLSAVLGPRMMLEIGDHAEAERLLAEGRSRIEATGSLLFESYSLLLEAEFELRLHDDPPAARAVLASLTTHPVASSYAFLSEQVDMLTGLILLHEGRDEEAVTHLRSAVAGMQRGERLLFLSTAATYLSEAEWRVGQESAADDAAELARLSAQRQGSDHYLLKALAEFPDVLARRLDLEASADSPWHQIGRGLVVRGMAGADAVAADVEVIEFGRAAIHADGVDVSPGLNKSVELLAFMANRDNEAISRSTLLDALFGGRRGDSASSYLRQASLKLRRVIPEVFDPDTSVGVVRLGPGIRVSTESRRLISLLGEASAQRGKERLRLLLDALEIADRGSYLPGVSSHWVEDRRLRLDELVRSARLEAAEVAHSEGLYAQASSLVQRVLQADPYREAAWRLEMRLARTHGDHDRVITAYRACEAALAELGTEPSPTTTRLLRDSRR
jgi:DNA-binding SARP family transcriptional activator